VGSSGGCDEVVMSCDTDGGSGGGIPLLLRGIIPLQNGSDLTKAKRNSKIK